jgi:glycosyltransferase involved in cell wall biosynthesis
LYDIIHYFSTNVKILQHVNTTKSEFDYTDVDLPLKLGSKNFHIRISKSKYLKLLNISEKFINLRVKKQSHKPVILLSDFSTQYYKEFFLSIPQSKNTFIKFDRIIPSFWNYDTYSTVKKSGCIIENFSSLIDDNIKKSITDSQMLINEKLDLLDNSDEIKHFFSLNEISFWNAFQKTFFKLLRNKFLEAITEIEILKKLFSKYKFLCVLVHTETRLRDLIIIKLAKRQNIPIILLQHGLVSLSKNILEYQKFYNCIPVYPDKFLGWGNIDLKSFVENGFPNSKFEILGAPFYDKIFQNKIPSYTELDNFILFATDFKSLHTLESITVESMKKYEAVINSVYNVVMKYNRRLVIRPHPQKDVGEKELAQKLDPKIKVVTGGSILPLIKSSSLVVVTDTSSVMLEAMSLNKPVISLRVNPDYDDEFYNPNACLRTDIEDFENNLSKILENEQFRNLLLKRQKIFLDENIANQGSASINLIKFLDNL